jgi:HlyD family secretion protein
MAQENTQPDRRRRITLIVVILLVLIGIGIALSLTLRHGPENKIEANGIVEATEVTLSSKLNARIADVYVQEGDTTTQNEVVVRLVDTDFREQVRQAQATASAAQQQLNLALAGTRVEDIEQARASVQQAQDAQAGARQALAIAQQDISDLTQLKGQLKAAQANYKAAQAAYQRAQQELLLVEQGPRIEDIQQAQAAVQAAQAAATKAKSDYSRYQTLFAKGAISASDLDAAQEAATSTTAQLAQAQQHLAELKAGSRPEEIQSSRDAASQASAQLAGAKDALQTAQSQYNERLQERSQLNTAQTQYQTSTAQLAAAQEHLQELIAGPRPQEIAGLRAQLRQAQAAYAVAVTQLGNTVVRSPIVGSVITRSVEPGELATPGTPLVTLADLREVWLRVYVPETVYGRISLGQEADVTVDSYPGEVFKGKVTEINQQAEFTPKEIQTPEQRTKLVFGLKVTISNPGGKLKPGMPASASLTISSAPNH